jgi:hypothetical protein
MAKPQQAPTPSTVPLLSMNQLPLELYNIISAFGGFQSLSYGSWQLVHISVDRMEPNIPLYICHKPLGELHHTNICRFRARLQVNGHEWCIRNSECNRETRHPCHA